MTIRVGALTGPRAGWPTDRLYFREPLLESFRVAEMRWYADERDVRSVREFSRNHFAFEWVRRDLHGEPVSTLQFVLHLSADERALTFKDGGVPIPVPREIWEFALRAFLFDVLTETFEVREQDVTLPTPLIVDSDDSTPPKKIL